MNDDFEVAGAPSANEIRANILRTADIQFWRPFSEQDGTATDLAGLSPGEANRLLQARLTAGPGPSGNAYQHAIHEHMKTLAEKERERDAKIEQIVAYKGYDPATGEGVPSLNEEQKVKLSHEVSLLDREITLMNSPAGKARIERALQEAIKAVQTRHRAAYIDAEAKRRAAQSALDAEIERAADGYRKTQSRL